MPNRQGPTRNRDNQRQRVYDAEEQVSGYWGHTIANGDLQQWVDGKMSHRAVQARWGLRKIIVHRGRGGGLNIGRDIWLGVKARNPWVICHEVAHALIDAHPIYAHHGPEFAGVYLFLVKTWMGYDEWLALRNAFRSGKVRVSNAGIPEPTRPVVTKTERAKKAAEAKRIKKVEQTIREMTRCNEDNRLSAAVSLRAQIKHGIFGPVGSTARKRALVTAGYLEGHLARAAAAPILRERIRLMEQV